MAKFSTVTQVFNTGQIDKNKLHRQDLTRVRLGAEEQTNLLGCVTGEMMMRPGLEYLGEIDSDQPARLWGYYRSDAERAVLEFSHEKLRVWHGDALIARQAVSSTIPDGDFTLGNIIDPSPNWALSDGASIPLSGGTAIGVLRFQNVPRGRIGIAKQQVSTSSPGDEHGLRVVVRQGPVTLRVGAADGADDYIRETELGTGAHSIAFTPAGDYWVQLSSASMMERLVNSVQIEGAGVLELPTPWTSSDLPSVRLDTSLDVVFVACAGRQQQRIERRSNRSWSVVLYETADGPFSASTPVGATLTRNLDTTTDPFPGSFTASRGIFDAGNLGGLIRIWSSLKIWTFRLGEAGAYTDPVRVSGIKKTHLDGDEEVVDYNDRKLDVLVTGTWEGEIGIERSFDGVDYGFKPFRISNKEEDAGETVIDSNGAYPNDDSDDNAIVWYRARLLEHTSGVAQVTISYEGDFAKSVFRVRGIDSPTIARIAQLENQANAGYANAALSAWPDWNWSDWPFVSGWPASVALHEGRLFWGGRDKLWGSISDAYDSFDDEFEGDAGPINRAIATGGSNEALWMLSLEELVIGTNTSVVSARASVQGEILTPADTTIKQIAGSAPCAPVSPVRIGNEAMFVGGTGTDLRLIRWTGSGYAAVDVSKITTEIFGSGILEIAFQSSPDPRVWAVTGDGRLICVVYDPDNEVLGFFPCETDGVVESVTVLPGAGQDRVYVSVRRVVNDNTVRYLEKMALDSETKPGALCKVMDSFTVRTASGTTVSGLGHLIGNEVVVWANGVPVVDENGAGERFTVSAGGEITLPAANADQQVVVGLPYRGRYKSGRLGYGVEGYSPVSKRQRLVDLGLLMTDYVRAGIRFGTAFDNPDHPLDGLPVFDDTGAPGPEIVNSDVNDEQPFLLEGGFSLDTRLCLEVESPFTAKFLAMSMGIETNG